MHKNLNKYSLNREVIIFSDLQRGSFKIIGELYRKTLEGVGLKVQEIQTPLTDDERNTVMPLCQGKIVFFNTLGEAFVPFSESYNIALPVHEWSLYPNAWSCLLNRFDDIWVTTDHVRRILISSGVAAPISIVPPDLTVFRPKRKQKWEVNGPFRFLAVGDAHFRKGFHLLMEGFARAFPDSCEATLTIKTSPGCDWIPPREDIFIVSQHLPYDEVLGLYQSFDCYVSASLGEGLGLPIAEAVLAHLPVATNNWGGHRSLLRSGDYFKIRHDEVDQPFCSDPAFYQDGQSCALSRPQYIAETLRAVVGSSEAERKHMAEAAEAYFLTVYGDCAVKKNICERLGL